MEGEDINYILQAIGNEVRRRILFYVAKEGPISYTKLMKRVGIEDSGTFGFHLRKMQRLLRKDDMGEYVLSDLGEKAIDILKRIGYVSEGLVEEGPKEAVLEESRGEGVGKPRFETKVISDMLSYEFTENIARMYREKGIRIIFRDIIKLVIRRMPKELFDEVVEEIDDCLTVHCPKDLSDLVQIKSREVFHIKVVDGALPRAGIPLDLSFIGDMVSGVVSSVMEFVPKLVSKGLVKDKLRLVVDEEYSLDGVERLSIECSGGISEIYFGEKDRLRIWSHRDEPSIDIDRWGDVLSIDVSGDRLELKTSRDSISSLSIDTSGGIIRVKSGRFNQLYLDVNGGAVGFKDIFVSNEFKVDVSGGVVNIGLSKDGVGSTIISGELSGGILKLHIGVPRDTKVKVDARHLGGYLNVKRGGERLPIGYVDPGFESADNRLEIRLDLSGGYADIMIMEM